MKNSNKNKNGNTLKKQGGYTLVELSLVLIVILLLGGGIFSSFTALYNSAKDQQVEEEVLQFGVALQRCVSRDSTSLAICDEAKIQLYSGLTSTTTACGDTWSAVTARKDVTITYPLSKCEDFDSLGDSLAIKMNLPNASASYVSPNLTIIGTL